jgi:hypothetical protein
MDKNQQTIRTGIYSFIGIALFFLLMKLFGWEDVAFLRVFNLVIVVYMTNRLAKRNFIDDHDIEYSRALFSLLIANGITVALSVLSFALYVKFIDREFLENFGDTLWLGGASVREVVSALFLEGIAGSIIVSFSVMQYWKDMKHKRPEEAGFKNYSKK